MNTLNTITKQLTSSVKHFGQLNIKRHFVNIAEESKRQNELFLEEQKKQREAVGRVEKIDVQYEGPPRNETLVMNKNISTPYECAKHLGDSVQNKAVVALLNGESLWHMHRPIPDACKLEFLHYYMPNPISVNKTFWRSCSFLLGAIVSNAFKDNIELHLHSFPSPNVKSGSFVYDVQLSLDDWKPTVSELKVLSMEMIKFCQKEHHIECLTVSKDLASEIFRNNPHKSEQIPNIAEHNGDKVSLYKVDTHIDISKGPMVPNTSHLGRITVANVIKLDTDIAGSPIYRFQGVALPRPIVLNHFAYSLLEERAKTLNIARIPKAQEVDNEDSSFVASVAQ